MPGAVQVLGPLQWGGHEEQEGPVHAVNGGQVTSAAGTEPCFGLELWGVGETETHTLRWMNGGRAGGGRHARRHTHAHWHGAGPGRWASPLISTCSVLSLLSQEQWALRRKPSTSPVGVGRRKPV